jgi:tryptophan-rich sensory protein
MKTIMLRDDWNWTPWRPWEARRSETATMLMRRANSTQYNLQEPYFVKSGVGIAAIWIAFYAVIALTGMVVHGVSRVAALH